jgi:hypothetical protein
VLTLSNEDSKKYIPDMTLIGSKWEHFKTKKVYSIVDFVFNAETENFFGFKLYPDGVEECIVAVPRFKKVSG